MPELPEVETTRRGIAPHIQKRRIREIIVRQPSLRWPVPAELPQQVRNRTVHTVERRGKYILLQLENGAIIIHLGMSGSLRICRSSTPVKTHDHVDFVISHDTVMRYHDPRRFGTILWSEGDPFQHKLLAPLGPEPLGDVFNTEYLYRATRKRSASIKSVIMNSRVVVGVGNIYACESLFRSGINPKRKAGSVSKERIGRLLNAIRQVLGEAIEQGGTTLRDFVREDGSPGYFRQKLFVYGRTGEPCRKCGATIRQISQQQRSTFYCPKCQK